MEFFHELFFTAVIAVLFSFLIAKLVSMAMSADSTRDSQSASADNVDRIVSRDSDEAVIMEELQFYEKLQVEEHGSEKVTQVVEEVTEIVEKFVGDAMVETASSELPTESAEEVEAIDTSRSLSAKASVEGGEVVENAPPMLLAKASIEEIKDVVNVRSESSAEGLIEEVEKDRDVEDGEKIDVEKCEDVAAGKVEEGKEVVEIDVEDDDWEGIERSEVEKVFAEAVKFVERGAEKNERFGSEAEMELYGLHKVATEGPCHEQPPMALKLAARAKWNAWQKLGNMNPEMAMEQYVALVLDRAPEWKMDKPAGDDKIGLSKAVNPEAVASNLTTFSSHEPNFSDEIYPEAKGAAKNDLIGESKLVEQAME